MYEKNVKIRDRKSHSRQLFLWRAKPVGALERWRTGAWDEDSSPRRFAVAVNCFQIMQAQVNEVHESFTEWED